MYILTYYIFYIFIFLGSENEDPKDKFVTVRKQCQSMIDFDTGHTSEDFINEKKSGLRKFKNSEKLNEQEIVEKKCKFALLIAILKWKSIINYFSVNST